MSEPIHIKHIVKSVIRDIKEKVRAVYTVIALFIFLAVCFGDGISNDQ